MREDIVGRPWVVAYEAPDGRPNTLSRHLFKWAARRALASARRTTDAFVISSADFTERWRQADLRDGYRRA